MTSPRISLHHFPDVILHAADSIVLRHPSYRAAKAGDIVAADRLVAPMANPVCINHSDSILSNYPDVELVSVHALESDGVNEIPAALAMWLARQMRRKN